MEKEIYNIKRYTGIAVAWRGKEGGEGRRTLWMVVVVIVMAIVAVVGTGHGGNNSDG